MTDIESTIAKSSPDNLSCDVHLLLTAAGKVSNLVVFANLSL